MGNTLTKEQHRILELYLEMFKYTKDGIEIAKGVKNAHPKDYTYVFKCQRILRDMEYDNREKHTLNNFIHQTVKLNESWLREGGYIK